MTKAGLVIWHRMSSTQDRNVHASLNPAEFSELSSRLQVCRMRGLFSFILLDTWMICLRYIHISTWVPSVSYPVTDVRSCPPRDLFACLSIISATLPQLVLTQNTSGQRLLSAWCSCHFTACMLLQHTRLIRASSCAALFISQGHNESLALKQNTPCAL